MSRTTGSSRAVGVPVTVGPLEALTRAVRGSFRARGRASRSEYWWFQLVYAVVVAVSVVVDARLGLGDTLLLVVVLGTLPTAVSLCVRRLHDAGYSGGWFFVQFLPFIGSFWLLILVVQPSQRRANPYGPGPDDLLPH